MRRKSIFKLSTNSSTWFCVFLLCLFEFPMLQFPFKKKKRICDSICFSTTLPNQAIRAARLQRLPHHHQEHGPEQPLLPTLHQRLRRLREAVPSLLGAGRRKAQRLQGPHEPMRWPATGPTTSCGTSPARSRRRSLYRHPPASSGEYHGAESFAPPPLSQPPLPPSWS